MLADALQLTSYGWRVLPVWGLDNGVCACSKAQHCPDTAKHPCGRPGFALNGVHDATDDPDVVSRWFQQMPSLNVAVAPGVASGIVVIDIDARHDGEATWNGWQAEFGAAPETPMAITGGGGFHLYFAHPGGFVRNKVALGPGVDVRADDGYAIAPPSRHASGRRYEWELSSHPDDLAPAPLPGWLLERLRAGATGSVPRQPDPVIGNGQRNATLASFAGTMRNRGMSEAAIRAALLVENDTRCQPPLTLEEVEKIAASFARYPAPTQAGRRVLTVEV